MNAKNTRDIEKEKVLKAELEKGLASIQAGRVTDGKQVFTELYALLKVED
jgi:predicted transcriptional regulator